MKIELEVPDSLTHLSNLDEIEFFLQAALNRLLVGGLRYGSANRRKLYMRRMGLELAAYKKTGNFENLLNLANYAYLESLTPENSRLFFDPAAASVTREKLGGHIA